MSARRAASRRPYPGSGPGDRAGRELWALLAIAQRDVVKLLRDRPRLAVNLAFPVLLVAGLGSVLQPTVGRVTGLSAVGLAFSGVLAATMFQSTAAGMISIVEDRETDYSRALFVAPVARLTLVTGKIAGETLVALFQGGWVVMFAVAAGVRVSGSQLPALLAACLASCLLGGAFGLATVAVLPNQRSAMEIFQFLIIPQYLLGGVIVPLAGVAPFLDVIAGAMPLRYAVDLTRAAFYQGTPAYGRVVTGGPVVDLAVIGGLSVMLMAAGTMLFDYRERTR
jgi:ABC-2 type transport system permease protein